MSYYHQLLNQLSVRETAVDCARCVSDWECCTYRPFIANFLVGSIEASQLALDEISANWDFLIVGMAPGRNYRKQFSKKGKWGFGTDATLLCSFYEKKSGSCQIWNARPGVCRTFFCKSSHHEVGTDYWARTEELSWILEWALAEDFLHLQGWTLGEIRDVKNYLDEAALTHPDRLDPIYRFQDVSKAIEFYRAAREHVASLAPDYIMEIIGDRGRSLYANLLEDKAKLS